MNSKIQTAIIVGAVIVATGAGAIIGRATGPQPSPAADVTLAPETRALDNGAIETIVRDYVLANPEVIIEALNVYQARQEEDRVEEQRLNVASYSQELHLSASSPVIGNPEGSITLVEFFDYNCPFCRRMLDPVTTLIDSDQDVRMVMKEFPILGPASTIAARAALASENQGLYEVFHTTLMALTTPLTEEAVFEVAAIVGLDVTQLRIDMEAPEVEAELRANFELARNLGINGTPAFVIGDQIIPGAISAEQLRGLVDSQRSS